MIPKIIHFCWFGRNPLPPSAVRCIESWRKYLPGYEIKEWNEDNFDVNIIPYTEEAYRLKKYAFVSDYARFWILYKYGGLYFDTDVEILRNMDHIISNGAFIGFEQPREEIKNGSMPYFISVAPGLALGVTAGHRIYKELLQYYSNLHLIDNRGNINPVTIVKHTTDLLLSKGLSPDNTLQVIDGIIVYPWDYFCPQSFYTNDLTITENTVSIHLYSDSWNSSSKQRKRKLIKFLGPTITSVFVYIKKILR